MQNARPDRYDSHAHLDSDLEMVITRVLRAPRELVWRAFTDPDYFANWWGPSGFSNTTQHMDFRVGGQWRYTMHGPDGRDYPNLIHFTQIQAPSRIAYRHSGTPDTEPVHFETLITLEPVGEGGNETNVTLRAIFHSKEARDHTVRDYGALEGGKQTLARLAEFVARSIAPAHATSSLSRVVPAPAELVWELWTTPAHISRWFGPPGCTAAILHLDLRAGGAFHFSMRGDAFPTHYGLWTIREILAPHRLVFISGFADEQGSPIRSLFDANWPLEILTTVKIEPHAGIGRGCVITMTSTPLNASPAELQSFRDGTACMNQGWSGSFDRLAQYAATST